VKVLYGIQSTGNGHLTRSAKVVNRLVRSGCMVDTIVSGKNSQINFPFPIKHNFTGLTFHYNGKGSVDYWKTWRGLKLFQLMKDVRFDISSYDLVISDFEPISAWAAEFQDKVSFGISNQYSFLSKKTPRPKHKDLLGEGILKWMAPVKQPIGLHFEKYDSFIKPPIIRDSLLGSDITNKGHYTVYLSNWSYELLFKHFRTINAKFEIFTNVKKPFRFKNCYVKPINKTLFDESFKSCEGIITAGGFQTCSEALYLNKKLIVLPIDNQYEQLCNVESLNRLGVNVGKIEDCEKFISSSNNQKMIDWIDPTDEIISEILNLRVK
jgi:uncharacterized protein (TIGR00661 family)